MSTAQSAQADAAGRAVDDAWRAWIAENLMLEAAPADLVAAMEAEGIPAGEAAREVDLAARSPYVRGSERLRARLRKRDWLLAAHRKGRRLHTRSGGVERRHRLTRGAFLDEYYSANVPVIITGMMDDWPALGRWSLDYFEGRFGDRQVEVQCGRESGEDYQRQWQKYVRTLGFAEFVRMVRDSGVTNDFYLTANNDSANKAALAGLWEDVVQVPEYLAGGDPTGGFFWLGPAGTVTPFHHDLTNNFMAQVLGRKLVKIAPSWDLPLMGNHTHCYSQVDGRRTPASPRPAAGEPQVLEAVLGPGELLFLPIGCLHYVEALEASATVSFTNFAFDNDHASSYSTYDAV